MKNIIRATHSQELKGQQKRICKLKLDKNENKVVLNKTEMRMVKKIKM